MKKLLFAVMILMLALPVIVAGSGAYAKIGRIIFMEETVSPGEDMIMHVNVKNAFSSGLDDVSISAFVPDLGVMRHSGSFDIDSKGQETAGLILYIPDDAEEGQYWVRISVSSDGFRRTVYRLIDVE